MVHAGGEGTVVVATEAQQQLQRAKERLAAAKAKAAGPAAELTRLNGETADHQAKLESLEGEHVVDNKHVVAEENERRAMRRLAGEIRVATEASALADKEVVAAQDAFNRAIMAERWEQLREMDQDLIDETLKFLPVIRRKHQALRKFLEESMALHYELLPAGETPPADRGAPVWGCVGEAVHTCDVMKRAQQIQERRDQQAATSTTTTRSDA